MAKELWTVARAAEAMGCSEDTVRRLIRSGLLPAYQLSVRMTRLDPLDVYAYIESRKRKVTVLQTRTRVRKTQDPPRGGLNNSGYYPGMKVV